MNAFSKRKGPGGSKKPAKRAKRNGFLQGLLRLLGLSKDARVHINAPGIDVVLTGDPSQVRALLAVVTDALERGVGTDGRPSRRRTAPQNSQVVRPTELDEMDSPYALPEAMVMPVEEDREKEKERTYEIPGRRKKSGARAPIPRAPSLGMRDELETGPAIEALDDEPDPERTAIEAAPNHDLEVPMAMPVDRRSAPRSQRVMDVDTATVEVHSSQLLPKAPRNPEVTLGDTGGDLVPSLSGTDPMEQTHSDSD